MKLTFAPTDEGITSQRNIIDTLGSAIARVWLSEDSPHAPGEVFDVQIRYADYSGHRDSLVVRRWNRVQDAAQSTDFICIADRIHIY